jgi:hypothetical protein
VTGVPVAADAPAVDIVTTADVKVLVRRFYRAAFAGPTAEHATRRARQVAGVLGALATRRGAAS